jgi:hypothetical protein
MSETRKLAAILVSDVVGYSRLAGADEDRILARLRALRSDDELAAVTAALRRAIEDDRYPRAPRLDPLRAAPARLEAAATPEPTPLPKAPSAGKGGRATSR